MKKENTPAESPKIFRSKFLQRSEVISRRRFLKNFTGVSMAGGAVGSGISGCGGGGGGGNTQISACVQELADSHDRGVSELAFSADGNRIATGSADGTVKIWNATTGELINGIRWERGGIYSVALSADGERVAAGSSGVTHVWEAATGDLVSSYEASGVVQNVSFSLDDMQLIAAFSGIIHIWQVDTAEALRQYDAHAKGYRDTALSHDGSKVASLSYNEMVNVWDYASLEEINTGLIGSNSDAIRLTTTPLTSTITISGSGETVGAEFNIDILTDYPDDSAMVIDLTSPAGTIVRLWDHQGDGEILRVNFPQTEPSQSLDALLNEALDGNWTLSITVDSEQDSGSLLYWAIRQEQYRGGFAVAFGKQNHIVYSDPVGNVQFWDYATQQPAGTYDGHERSVIALAVSPDGSKVVSADNTFNVHLWRYDSKQLISRYTLHESAVFALAFSPDSRRIVSGGNEHRAQVWNADSGEQLFVLQDPATVGEFDPLTCEPIEPSGCTCDTVCSCDTVCTCDAQGGGGGGGGSHYWYPN